MSSTEGFTTLAHLLGQRAREKPDQPAYTFLSDGEVEAAQLTYRELDHRARVIAAHLGELELQGERALLLYPPGLEFIAALLGCFYAGVVAVPAYPPRRRRVELRLKAIARDCRPAACLTQRTIHSRAEALAAEVPELAAVKWLETPGMGGERPRDRRPAEPDPRAPALLQYTSGSTGSPKGVMVSHGNLLHNEEMIRQAFEQSEESVVVGWLPLYHDMGLIGNVLQPLYLGARCYLMSPMAFLRRPRRWLEAISRYRGTTSGGPNFAYDLCVRRIGAAERRGLDLSSWSVAFNGSEPVRAETLERFAEAFTPCGFRRQAFYPCYGLAETTLFVTGGSKHEAPALHRLDAAALERGRAEPEGTGPGRALVGCGRPRMGQEVAVADPVTRRRLAEGQVGEIWVCGPSVAAGYWRRPEATDFGSRLAEEPEAGPYLRTGDLGFLSGGELFVTGRLKEMIIVRGRNLYPHDVELTAERAHPSLRPGCAAAFSIEAGGEEQLVAVIEAERRARPDVELVAEAVRRAVTEEHDVRTHAVVLLEAGALPKTSSGKIRRRACREAYLAGELKTLGESVLDAAATAAVEEATPGWDIDLSRRDFLALAREDRRLLLGSYLGRQVEVLLGLAGVRIDPRQPLAALGLDSLTAMEIQGRVETDLGFCPDLSGLLEGASIADLAEEITAASEAEAASEGQRIVARGEPAGEFPLSRGQEALWFLHCLAPRSAAYNVAAAARLGGELDAAALRRSFQVLVERHASLRTRYLDPGGEPCQQVHPRAEEGFSFTLEEAREWDEARIAERLASEARRAFDLRRGPLLRVLLLRRGAAEHVLVLVVHHVAADFWSLAVLVEELGRVYLAQKAGDGASALPPLELTYSDYVEWQREMLAGEEGARLEAYWLGQLAGELPVLDLTPDRPRPPVQTYEGAAAAAALAPELHQRLRELGSAAGVTPYMTLLAAFQSLLHRYTGQRDILVGSPTSGRTRPELAGLVGYLVNPVVMRGDLGGDPSFEVCLTRLRRTVLEALKHQGHPFDLLVERLRPERKASLSPIFQVLFSFQQTPHLGTRGLEAFALGREGTRLLLGGLEWEPVALEEHPAQLDLELVAAAAGGTTGLSLRYNRDLFEAATARRMLGHLTCLLEGIVAEPRQPISALPLLSAAEQRQIDADWNATQIDYPRGTLVHQLVEEQVRRTPETVALACGELGLTYGELDAAAERLARRLRRLGAAPEKAVAICMERCPEMVVALLGVLKAGAAYVPLDPGYPQERLRSMLEEAAVLLTRETDREALRGLGDAVERVVAVDGPEPAGDSGTPPGTGARGHPDNLAYVIYTSGSTGKPKGVQIPHRAVVNFLGSMRQSPGLSARDVLLAVTTLSFDIAVLEIFLPLTVGARVVLASRQTAADGVRLGRELARRNATVMQATPATWQLLLETGWPGQAGLEVLCGGEALPADLARQLLERGAGLWNMYGPTETTVWSAVRRVGAGENPVRVGGAIGNTRLHVLDARLRPLPVGVPGEVYVGGDGLARGYVGRPGLTAASFRPDPLRGETGGRLYRVGDTARRREDGTLEFFGRVDHQVKLRGFRIELGEIESVLSRHPAVRRAVVGVRQDPARLVAWLLTHGGTAPETGELRSFLAHSLPDYMVPAVFVTLEELPLTPNGKVDRAALGRRALPALRPAPPAAAGRAPRTEVEQAVAELWCEVLGLDSVGLDDSFFDLGGHSLLVARLHRLLVERFRRDDLTVVDLFQYPTVGSLARFLAPEQERDAARRPSREARRGPGRGDVAIVGMAGRFPGAPDVEAYWRNLRDGIESITFFTDDELTGRVDPAALADPRYVKARGVLAGAEEFDAGFFGFNPREAEIMDPQHRVFLECAWEALDNAGFDTSRATERIGLYAGVGMNTYLLHTGREVLESAAGSYQAFIGNDKDFVPTRVSYKLNLRGPSVNVQTACSSSLVAVHLACQSLAAGESDVALAGGVAVRVPQVQGYFHEAGGILSPDGHCRAFDAAARGTVFGNGVGVVVLKPLDAALAGGDQVLAVIKGTAVNNDGSFKIGYTAPSVEGQAEVVAAALADAGVEPHTLGYVETHGTGTELGDPIEITALRQAFEGAEGPADSRTGYCALGSVKTNIGHLDTAAGIAGLIKTVLALGHGAIPPSLHFETPNPRISFDDSPFRVNRTLTEWRAGAAPRRAGVSSFGIGGTNAHVVLEEAPPAPETGASRPSQLLVLSARTPGALESATRRLAEHLRDAEPDLADAAYTLQVGRRAFDHRRWVVVHGLGDAVETLAAVDPERVRTGSIEGAPASAGTPGRALQAAGRRVVFLFSGQGSQYVEMGRGLYESEPVFRAEVDRGAELLEPRLGLDLRQVLYPPAARREEAGRLLVETRLAQPALFVVEHALARLWGAWGITPAAMIGHSIGELVAACLAGVFCFEDALALVAARGRLMQAQPPGSMLAVGLSEAEAEPYLGDELALATVNGPADCVISGPTEAVAALERRLAEHGVRCRRLHTSHAFHSAMMEPAVEPFVREVETLRLGAPELPFVSNVTGTWITEAEATDPRYWGRHMVAAVRFGKGVETLLEGPSASPTSQSPGVFLEVGPGRALTTLARQQARHRTFVTSLPHPQDRSDDESAVLEALGRLWQAGTEVDWPGFYSGRQERRRRVALPPYPFERQRYWLEPGPRKPRGVPERHDGLRKKTDAGAWFYAPVWKQSFLTPSVEPAETAPPESEVWLVLAGAEGLGRRLVERLTAPGRRLLHAAPGDGFDPRRREDYTALLDALETPPDHVVHAGSVDAPAELGKERRHGFESLLACVQALAARGGEAPVRLSVLTRRVQKVDAAESVEPAAATLLGLLKVVPQELPHFHCRAIDVAPAGDGGAEDDDLATDLALELTSGSDDDEVAYRNGCRWVRSFEPLRLESPAGAPSRWRRGGVYLITGGLGGVGLELARALAAPGGVRLVLTDLSPLPPREEWEARTAARSDGSDRSDTSYLPGAPDDAVSRKIRAVRELEAAGSEVLVLAADVTDPPAMAAAVQSVRERWGAVHGVIHAAGLPGGGILQTRTSEEAAAVLAPKVEGTLALGAALAGEPLDFFLLCSSINSVVGGFGQGDYCAANAFLDAFARAEASRRGPLVVSINWDRWRGVGMAAALAGIPGSDAAPDHPLLGTCLLRNREREVYRAVFNAATQWVLSEHRVAGRPTVPGTAYLEMARAAFAPRAAGRPLEIREVVFLEPLAVDEQESREVLTLVDLAPDTEKADTGKADTGKADTEKADTGKAAGGFRVVSRPLAGSGTPAAWQEHCRGKVTAVAAASLPALALGELRGRSTGQITARDGTARAASGFLVAGPRWQALERIFTGEDEHLAELALPEAVARDVEQLPLHPALLDVGVGFARLLREGNFLPLAYERLRIDGPLPARLWSHVKLRSRQEAETISCDVALVDEAGIPRVTAEGFSMKRVGEAAVAELAGALGKPAETAPGEVTPAAALLEGTIEPADGAEVLRRVLAARRLPPQLVVSPRDLEAVRASYQAFDPARVLAELEQLSAPRGMHARPELGTAYVMPGEGLEKVIAEVWQGLLGIEQVGVHDNFFELGGTSLVGVQVVGELKERLGRDIPTVSLFEAPTVSALAKYLEPPADAGKAFEKTRSRVSKKKLALEQTQETRGRRARRKR